MKIKTEISQKLEFEAKFLQVKAEVRYWEDANVNDVRDENGDLIPCRNANNWEPLIDIETGQIVNWDKGKTADIHYKTCDLCLCTLLDAHKNKLLKTDNQSTPDFLCPKNYGYGDYIIMVVDENGFIKDWDFSKYNKEEWQPAEQKPQNRYELTLQLGANSFQDLLQALKVIHLDLHLKGDFFNEGSNKSFSGSPTACYSMDVKFNPNQTAENYLKEIETYLKG